MALRPGRGPSFEEDSFYYKEVNPLLPNGEEDSREEEYLKVIDINPAVSRQYGNNPEED